MSYGDLGEDEDELGFLTLGGVGLSIGYEPPSFMVDAEDTEPDEPPGDEAS